MVLPSGGTGCAGVRARRLLVPSVPCLLPAAPLVIAVRARGSLVARWARAEASLSSCGLLLAVCWPTVPGGAVTLSIAAAVASGWGPAVPSAALAFVVWLGDRDRIRGSGGGIGIGGGADRASRSSRARRLPSACTRLRCILALCSSVMVLAVSVAAVVAGAAASERALFCLCASAAPVGTGGWSVVAGARPLGSGAAPCLLPGSVLCGFCCGSLWVPLVSARIGGLAGPLSLAAAALP